MKQELFNNKTKAEDYQRQPKQLGLYEASHEHDACGVGMLVNICLLYTSDAADE